MREFTSILRNELTQGLPPSTRASRSADYLHGARAVRSGPFGLEPVPSIVTPFAVPPVDAFPFPQLFVGQNVRLLFTETTVSRVNSDWTLTPLSLFDPADGAPAVIAPGGGVWHFVDLRHAWYAFNGVATVFQSGLDKMQADPDTVYVQSGIPIQTGCHHRGRVVVGGFTPGAFWPSNWTTMMTALAADNPTGFDPAFGGLDSNMVLWSSIGGGDMPMWLFWPQGYVYDLEPTLDDVLLRLKRNEWGFMPMSWFGEIRGVFPLSDKIVVMGEGGVSYLTLRNGDYGETPLLDSGIVQRGAFAGGTVDCFFVTEDGTLWQFKENGELRELGYSQLLAPFFDEDLSLSFDRQRRVLYINAETEKFVLDVSSDRAKLTEGRQRVNSLARVGGGTIGTFSSDASAAALVVTGPLDFGLDALKSVNGVAVKAQGGGNLRVAYDFRYKRTDAWTRTPFVDVNNEGNMTTRFSGLEFRIVVQASDWSTFLLQELAVRWHTTDRRNIRGPIAARSDETIGQETEG